jgi:hypothetical protein
VIIALEYSLTKNCLQEPLLPFSNWQQNGGIVKMGPELAEYFRCGSLNEAKMKSSIKCPLIFLGCFYSDLASTNRNTFDLEPRDIAKKSLIA